MGFRVRNSFFVFVLIAGVILAANTSPKIPIAAVDESRDRAPAPEASAVRHPRQRRWLDELGRLKGGRSVYTSLVKGMELSDVRHP